MKPPSLKFILFARVHQALSGIRILRASKMAALEIVDCCDVMLHPLCDNWELGKHDI